MLAKRSAGLGPVGPRPRPGIRKGVTIDPFRNQKPEMESTGTGNPEPICPGSPGEMLLKYIRSGPLGD